MEKINPHLWFDEKAEVFLKSDHFDQRALFRSVLV